MKIETSERRSLWHKYVSIAVLILNTSYHTKIGCEPSRVFHGRIPYNILHIKLGIRPQQATIPTLRIALDVLHQTQMIYQAKMPCKLTSIIKAIATKKPTLQSSKKQVTYISYSRKPIIKGGKISSRNFGGLALTLLQRCYLITVKWYAKLSPTRRQWFIACRCVSSHPANLYLIYESRHRNGHLIRKWASNTMICMPERGSVNTKGQFLTPKMTMQRDPIHPKFQYSAIY